MDQRMGIVGAGNMGLALMRGLLDGVLGPKQISVSNRRRERSEQIAAEYGVRAATNAEAVREADVVLLAVKPQMFAAVLPDLRGALKSDVLVVSVAAGIRCARIEAELGGDVRVVRAMPNTPATVKRGATAIARGANATDADVALTTTIFESVGIVRVVEEKHLDAITGLCGSGPAYVMSILEAFADAGAAAGLPREIAAELAVQTVAGACHLLQQTGETPGALKAQVTSPGGTTLAGLEILDAGPLRQTIIDTVAAAARRAGELAT